MKMKLLSMITLIAIIFAAGCKSGGEDAQDGAKEKVSYDYPFQDPSLDTESRIDDLMGRLTLEQKVLLMLDKSEGIDSLGIPYYDWWNECLHGILRPNTTVFPQAIGLAATWDPELMSRVSVAISDEGRALYNEYARGNTDDEIYGLTYWSPNINIFRDPRWGRGQETYGECPYLTAQFAVEFVKGLQGDDEKYIKLVSTPKHYAVHNGPEPERHEFNADTREYDLWNTYLPAFRAAVVDAKAYSVMCAYNRFRGKPCCGSDQLLQQILREKWGFKGYVVSDCGAIEDFWNEHQYSESAEAAASEGVKMGTDLNCGEQYRKLVEAVEQGLITEEEIDVSLRRLLRARFITGMFDPVEMTPWADLDKSVVESEKHRLLALEAANESMVLLKNEGTLPLSKDVKTIAVIGPAADDEVGQRGNYSGSASEPVTILDGIKGIVSDQTEVIYAQGTNYTYGIYEPEKITADNKVLYIDADKKQKGMKLTYFEGTEFAGEPLLEQVIETIDYKAPEDKFANDQDSAVSIRWEGYFIPEKSGRYILGINLRKGYIDFDFDGKDFIGGTGSGHDFKYVEVEAGKAYPIKIDYYKVINKSHFHLTYKYVSDQKEELQQMQDEALAAAEKADVVIMTLGLTHEIEGEEMSFENEQFRKGDRVTIDLPRIQDELLRKVHALGKPVVLVVMGGSAISLPWEAENIPAILQAWYPGQSGQAVANVLFGEVNPGGKLPVTIYTGLEQLGDFRDYNMQGKTYRYMTQKPLWQFGYGLSYTTFEIGAPKVAKTEIGKDESLTVEVEVKNTGQVDGDEVVQLYIKRPDNGLPHPLKDLRAFERVSLKAGESKTVKLELSPEKLAYVDPNTQDDIVATGEYTIMVGNSSAGEDLQSFTLTVK